MRDIPYTRVNRRLLSRTFIPWGASAPPDPPVYRFATLEYFNMFKTCFKHV